MCSYEPRFFSGVSPVGDLIVLEGEQQAAYTYLAKTAYTSARWC